MLIEVKPHQLGWGVWVDGECRFAGDSDHNRKPSFAGDCEKSFDADFTAWMLQREHPGAEVRNYPDQRFNLREKLREQTEQVKYCLEGLNRKARESVKDNQGSSGTGRQDTLGV